MVRRAGVLSPGAAVKTKTPACAGVFFCATEAIGQPIASNRFAATFLRTLPGSHTRPFMAM